jgi:hypothetical protein
MKFPVILEKHNHAQSVKKSKNYRQPAQGPVDFQETPGELSSKHGAEEGRGHADKRAYTEKFN